MNSNQGEDYFDSLPDALVVLIFNKLHDAKSLSRCSLVCKRFGSIIPQIDTISLTIPRRNPILCNHNTIERSNDRYSKSSFGRIFSNLFKSFITQPLRMFLQIMKYNSIYEEDDHDCCSYHSPNEVLRQFNEIRSLQIELPSHGGEIQSNGTDVLLKWKAEFGSKLESCVILGATSFYKNDHRKSKSNGDEEFEQRDSSFTEDELKLRVVWTISCLIAASARHYLLQKLVSEQPMLENVIIRDEIKQGSVCMNDKQIEEFRNSMDSTAVKSDCLERSRVPGVRMKLWYVPVLELPTSGYVMEGATLVVITPVEGSKVVESDSDLVVGAFGGDEGEEVFGEAVMKMVKKKTTTYTLEMSSF